MSKLDVKADVKVGAGASGGKKEAEVDPTVNPLSAPERLEQQLNKAVSEYLTIHRAAYLGRPKSIESLLDEGVNADALEASSGLSCLMLAASAGHTKVCSVLITKGRVNVNLQNTHASGGLTALHYAAMNDHVDVMKVLLENKANPNIEDDAGNTAVNVCARMGHVQGLEVLIERGGSLDHANKKLSTPLLGATTNARSAIVDLLIRYESKTPNAINFNSVDARGNTALHVASSLGYSRLMKQLLKIGVRKDITNIDGQTAEQCALNESIAKLLKDGDV